MSYGEISLEETAEEDLAIVRAVMDKGKAEMKEEVLAKIERKITENYHDKEMVNFLEELIRDLDLDL